MAPPSAAGGSGLPAPERGADAVLYVVDGRGITNADLGDFILRYFPDRARDALGQLVDEALVTAEAGREGVDVAAGEVRARADAYIEERRRDVRIQYGPDAVLEQLLAERFGRDFESFRRDAERLARVALLRDRLVRLDQIREARVEVRALVFPDRAAADAGLARLRDGADMTLLAERLGLRAPAAPAPLARSDVRPAERAEELFAAAPGDLLGPTPFEAPDGRTCWEVVKVVAAWPGDGAPWPELRERVEAELRRRAVGVPEYLAWRGRAIERAAVEVRRGGRGLVPWLGEDAR